MREVKSVFLGIYTSIYIIIAVSPTTMFVLYALTLLAYSVAGECPKIVTRSEWGAVPAKEVTPLNTYPPPFVVIHHSDGRNCTNSTKCKKIVAAIQAYHMHDRKWNDIGYNFLVGGDGLVYEGRGFYNTGAHCPKYNSRSLGVCLLGTFQKSLPTDIQLEATKAFIECAKEQGHLTSDYHLIGHRQGRATTCPGDALFQEITKWSHFDPNPS